MNKSKTCMGGLMLAVIFGLVGLPAQAQKGQAVALTDRGQALQEQYAQELTRLQAQITDALPQVNPRVQSAYLEALDDEVSARAELDQAKSKLNEVKNAHGLVGHAKRHWIPKADRNIAKAQEALSKAKTQAERDAAQAEVKKWQDNREAGLEALEQRQAAYEKAKQNEPKYRQDIQRAERALDQAKAKVQRAMASLRVAAVLTNDRHDAKLAKFVLLKEATPKELATFAQQGSTEKMLVDQLLADDELMVQMLLADGAKDGNYGRAMQIYTAIQSTSDKAKQGTLQRLALAISLEHATPISQRNPNAATDAPKHIDPVNRYKHYEQAFLNDELDPYFKDHSAWNLRFVVNGNEPDAVLAWGREMLRNYRPDLITMEDDRWRYVALVRTCVRYGSQENKNDKDELQFYQNILMNGGICGRRAFFGRFILRSFGVPTVAKPQTGHAALGRWTPDGWAACLGAGWNTGWAPGRQMAASDFLAITQARELGDHYMQIKRAQWIADVNGERRKVGLLTGNHKPEFWNSVALNTQRQLIEQAGSKALAAVGEELGEANESNVEYPFEAAEVSKKDREITIDRNGVITIPAAATSSPTKSTGKVLFTDSVLGGKQLHYSRGGNDHDFEYTFNAPAAGTYALTMRVSTPSWKQKLSLIANAKQTIGIELPHTVGLWETTQPIKVELVDGENVLRFTRKGVQQEVAVKGFTIKDFTLTPLKDKNL